MYFFKICIMNLLCTGCAQAVPLEHFCFSLLIFGNLGWKMKGKGCRGCAQIASSGGSAGGPAGGPAVTTATTTTIFVRHHTIRVNLCRVWKWKPECWWTLPVVKTFKSKANDMPFSPF